MCIAYPLLVQAGGNHSQNQLEFNEEGMPNDSEGLLQMEIGDDIDLGIDIFSLDFTGERLSVAGSENL